MKKKNRPTKGATERVDKKFLTQVLHENLVHGAQICSTELGSENLRLYELVNDKNSVIDSLMNRIAELEGELLSQKQCRAISYGEGHADGVVCGRAEALKRKSMQGKF